MAAQIIPLTTTPNQTRTVTGSINGVNVSLMITLVYNRVAGYWSMTITNPNTLAIILDSIPLVTGDYPTGNILGQYAYLGIGSMYIFNIDNCPEDYPDNTNLGSDFVTIWYDTPAA
jgi:hypothetical protein